jgi:hypothetical protein
MTRPRRLEWYHCPCLLVWCMCWPISRYVRRNLRRKPKITPEPEPRPLRRVRKRALSIGRRESQHSSSFLQKLPVEIRVQIYELVLGKRYPEELLHLDVAYFGHEKSKLDPVRYFDRCDAKYVASHYGWKHHFQGWEASDRTTPPEIPESGRSDHLLALPLTCRQMCVDTWTLFRNQKQILRASTDKQEQILRDDRLALLSAHIPSPGCHVPSISFTDSPPTTIQRNTLVIHRTRPHTTCLGLATRLHSLASFYRTQNN